MNEMLIEERGNGHGFPNEAEQSCMAEYDVADESVGLRAGFDNASMRFDPSVQDLEGLFFGVEPIDSPEPVIDEGAAGRLDLNDLRVVSTA